MKASQRRQREERGIIAGLVVVCIVLITVTILLLTSAGRTSALLLEYDASRLASILLEEYVQSDTLYFDTLHDRVVGAGIYDERGELVRGSGDIPGRVNTVPHHVTEAHVEFDRQSQTITLIRPVGMPSIMNDRMRRPMERMRPMDRGFVFLLRANAHAYFRTRRWYSAGLAIAPAAIIALIALIALYYLRARRYRHEADDRERLAQLGETARTLAHEIKNPLNAINLRARILRTSLPSGAHADISAIEHEVDRLRRLTDRIGDFLKNALGKPVVLDLRDRLIHTVQRHQWRVDTRTDDSDHYLVEFDELRLDSVLENLLSNAFEANETAGVSEQPLVTLTRERESIVVEVRDYGPGMSEEQIMRAFDPFFTTKTTGSGIGLAIVKRFVDAAEGSIEIDSTGDGTVMRVRLPEVPA